AALAAGRSGARVILAESDPVFGGALLRRAYRIGDGDGMAWAEATVAELAALPEVRLLPATTVTGHYDDNYLVAVERVGEQLGPAGRAALRRVRIARFSGDGLAHAQSRAIDCDLLALSGGWNPTLNLFAQAQGRMRFDERLATFVPDAIDAAAECVGAARGSF